MWWRPWHFSLHLEETADTFFKLINSTKTRITVKLHEKHNYANHVKNKWQILQILQWIAKFFFVIYLLFYYCETQQPILRQFKCFAGIKFCGFQDQIYTLYQNAAQNLIKPIVLLYLRGNLYLFANTNVSLLKTGTTGR